MVSFRPRKRGVARCRTSPLGGKIKEAAGTWPSAPPPCRARHARRARRTEAGGGHGLRLPRPRQAAEGHEAHDHGDLGAGAAGARGPGKERVRGWVRGRSRRESGMVWKESIECRG